MKKIRLLIVVIILFSFNKTSNGQCCAAGNPICDDGSPGSSGKGFLEATLLYKYSFSDTYYQGDQLSDYTYIKNSHFNFSSLNLKYTLTNKLKITADIGYFIDKTQKFSFGDFERKAFGLGDGSLGLQYSLFKQSERLFNIFPSVKMVFPIGQFDQVDGVVLLPIDIQPSAGSFKYNSGIAFSKRFENSKFALFSSNSIEISQRIETNRTNYKYGNLYNFALSGSYKFTNKLSGSLMVRSQHREKASNSKGEEINATGGHVVFVAPQLKYLLFDNWNTSISWEQPVYKNMNGKQLTNHYAFSVRISRAINFNKKQDTLKSLQNIAELKSASFNVDGACGMCKERIEKTVLKNKDVKWAEWNLEEKILTIKFKNLNDIEGLKASLAKAGHDTDTFKASDKAYGKLHSCCKYRITNK